MADQKGEVKLCQHGRGDYEGVDWLCDGFVGGSFDVGFKMKLGY